MIFRKAEKGEAEAVYGLYTSVIGSSYCNWNEYYPELDDAKRDLAADSLFVLEDGGRIIGAVSVIAENEMDDKPCWRVKENAGEFARVAVSPDCQGRGLSKLLVNGILEELAARGRKTVHISVAKVNIPAQRLYARLGFEIMGEEDMYGSSFWLCEKELDPKLTLYLRQKRTLDEFLARGAISKAQYDKSFGDLTEKMGMADINPHLPGCFGYSGSKGEENVCEK